MPRFYPVSDVHLDHWSDAYLPKEFRKTAEHVVKDISEASLKDFSPSMKRSENPTILIVAGDIVPYTEENFDDGRLTDFTTEAGKSFHKVYLTLGNHDFIYHGIADTIAYYSKAYPLTPKNKVIFLNNSFDTLPGGVRIHGVNLFSDGSYGTGGATYGRTMRFFDFQYINGFTFDDMVDLHRMAVEYIRMNVRDGDIVVSHHIPVLAGISERFRNDSYTRFFYSGDDKMLKNYHNLKWVFGHTHDHFHFTDGNGNEFFCNPYGYPSEQNTLSTEAFWA